MKVTASPRNRQAKKLSDADDSPLTPEEVRRFTEIFAPNPKRFTGSRNGPCRATPNLYGEFVTFDEHGEEHRECRPPRKVGGTVAMPVHMEAGRLQVPVRLPGSKYPPIRAVSIGYEEDDIVSHLALDLDGDYPIPSVMKPIRKLFGKRMVLHSGSGAVDRFRVFIRIRPMKVRRLQALASAIFTRLGFPPKLGGLEIAPAFKQSRIPGGAGGCRMFDPRTMKPMGGQNQATLVRAILASEAVDLDAIAKGIGIDPSGIDTGTARSRGRFDPNTRREPHRPTPRHIRRQIALGVREEGRRNRHTWLTVNNFIRSGYGLRKGIEKWIAYIEDGKMDASRFVKRFGRDALIKRAEKEVRSIYASAKPYGLPDPIALSEREIDLVKVLASRVPRTRYMSPYRAEKMLLAELPIFKAAKYAGLTKVRRHSDHWYKSGGIHYARMREFVGIFQTVGGYKPLYVVRGRKHLGAKDSEAYAYSFACSFDFDPPSGSVTYNNAIARSCLRECEVLEVEIHLPPSLGSDPLPLPSTASIDPTSFLQTATSSPNAQNQLYDHHKANEGDLEGSDPTQEDPSDTSTTPQPDFPPEAVFPYHPSWGDEWDAKRQDRKVARLNRPKPLPRPKPEWKRLQDLPVKGGKDMSLDEYFAATIAQKELVAEYQREKREAEKDRKHIERTHGVRLSLGKVASKRFHELRERFGLDPWN